MKIIGITGQSGSGKSYLAKTFEKLGYIHANADKIYHELLLTNAKLRCELVSTFGKEIEKDGTIDRKTLARKVFGKKNSRKLLKLNKIAHKYVCREYIKLIMSLKGQNAKGLVIDAPLLIEARLHKLCDINIYVYCDKELRIERIMSRDGISRKEAELRVCSQKDALYYMKNCDTVFFGDGYIPATDFATDIDKKLHGETDIEQTF
ncbi:MAG: dephospho-CoA kinase [Ruminococcaceae bacterium]|nr:dephospho-CoA kinase [Oscillospiraceae bacterium]